MHSRRGQYSFAERKLLHALHLLGRPRGKPTFDHLALWNELGMVCKYLGKFGKARERYRSALRYCDACLTRRDRYDALASLYHNLGGLEHARRRFRRAEPLARGSVMYRLRVRPRNSLSIAADRVALAAILDGLEKFAESEQIYRRALRTYRSAFGESHREIALVLNNLAALYQRTGRVGRAELTYRAALEMKRETVGRTHPEYAVTMSNLGMLLVTVKREREAGDYFEKAYRALGRSLGWRHPNTRGAFVNLENVRRGKRKR
jgi:tetratricopeptide (TPR) repeat protein